MRYHVDLMHHLAALISRASARIGTAHSALAALLLVGLFASGCHVEVVDEPIRGGSSSYGGHTGPQPPPSSRPPDAEPVRGPEPVDGPGPVEPAGVGATCGTRGAPPCSGDLFCMHLPAAACGETDVPGTCQPRPQVCTRDYRPVCGCDGRTYGNACSAHAAGVSVRQPGECRGSAEASCQRGGCAGELCVEPGDEVASICVARPEHACYPRARCERQADGACGWTMTRELAACLQSPPPVR